MVKMTIFLGCVLLSAACQRLAGSNVPQPQNLPDHASTQGGVDTATFAGGCFWCTEVQFQQLEGVDTVISGYTGGDIRNPTYKQVTTGKTGHAEAIHVIYRPDVITYDELLEAFFVAHDPTQLNRQGNDIGPQYRSAIFYHDAQEKEKAAYYIRRLTEEKVYNRPIVTTLEPYTEFFVAEDYHQNYFNLNPQQAYCQYVIVPKLDKFKSVFKERLKK